jgi:hypothetical protein
MQDAIDEACEAVQAAAAGKSKAAIRRMLTAEFRARDVSLPLPLFDVAVNQIAAGTYVPGEPLVSVRRSGLLSLPFIGKAIGRRLEPALEALRENISEEGIEHGVVRVTEHVADSWPILSGALPRPPGRDLLAPVPEEDVPPPARLIPDPDLRERIPELFEAPPPPPKWVGMPPSAEAELVFAWLDESGGTVAVCCHPGRLGVLNAKDAEAYLPLVRSAQAQGKVVAVTADIGVTARGLLPAAIRVVAARSGQGGRLAELRACCIAAQLGEIIDFIRVPCRTSAAYCRARTPNWSMASAVRCMRCSLTGPTGKSGSDMTAVTSPGS